MIGYSEISRVVAYRGPEIGEVLCIVGGNVSFVHDGVQQTKDIRRIFQSDTSMQVYFEVKADFYTPDFDATSHSYEGEYDFSALILLDGDTLTPHRVQRRLLKRLARCSK
jgi:hypothetical protein